MIAVADALRGSNVLLFNIGSPDDGLRGADCRANVFHIAPSRAMLTDALAQFLAFKRWRKLLLIVGPNPTDRAYADAMTRAARKFGLVIAAEKAWTFGPLAKIKGDSPTKADALVLTRGVDYDVAVVADEAGDFGDDISYRTWEPRPGGGNRSRWCPRPGTRRTSSGCCSSCKTASRRAADRTMRPVDYQAWVVVRAVRQAVTRAKSTDLQDIRRFMVGPDFTLAAFKGVPLSFRPDGTDSCASQS